MKARFFALAALVLGLASCQNDFDGANAGAKGEVDFQLSVAAPELATRAGLNGQPDELNDLNSAYGAIDYLQGGTANDELRTDWSDVNLRYTLEVFDADVDYASEDVNPVKDRQVIIVDEYEPVVFDLRLVPGRNYRFVVFADFVEQQYTNETQTSAIEAQRNLGKHHIIGNDLRDITVKNDGINDECSDAYFGYEDITITNSASNDIVLKRPYGKLRVIATDLHELNLNVNPAAVKVEYTAEHVAGFNAVTGAVKSEKVYATKVYDSEYNEIYKEDAKGGLQNHFYTADYDALEGHSYENANGAVRHTHMTLFTDYILASDQQHTVHFTMTVYDDKAMTSEIKATTFNTDIPVQRNYLTTVIGNVLTTATEIEVRIDDNFAGEIPADNDVVFVSTAAALQEALDNFVNGQIILFENNIEGNVTIDQVEGKDYIIDGNGFVYDGTMTIDGNARHNGAETVLIQNINFVTDKSNHDFIQQNSTDGAVRYAHNVTIKNCSFYATGETVVGMRFRQGYNIVVEDCVADGTTHAANASGLHSLAQLNGCTGVTIDGVDVSAKEGGVNLGTSTNVVIKNSTFVAEQYGVRADASVETTLNIENVNITAKIPVIARYATGNYTINFSGNNNFEAPGYQVVLTNVKDDVAYVAPTGNYTLNGAEGLRVFPSDVLYAYNAADLQYLLDNAVAGNNNICFAANIEGDVTVTQKAGVKITLDGNNRDFKGVILVDGKSATYTTAGLTIKNLNFNAETISEDACIRLGDLDNIDATRYTCNVTVDNCTFDVAGAVGVKSYTGGDKNLVITNSTITANGHSLVQAKGIDGILIENCNVYSKNGLNFNNSTDVVINQCTVDTKGYAARFGEGSSDTRAEVYTIKNSTLKSACEDGDAVVMLRGSAAHATLRIEDTTLEGSIKIANNATDAKVVYVVDGYEQKEASSQTELNDALKGESEVTLADGAYSLPSVSNGNVAITGSKDVVITINQPNFSGSDIEFNGVTVKGKGDYTGVQHVNTVTYNDVTIDGNMFLYGNKVVFNGCDFKLYGNYLWTYGAKEVEFNNCTFDCTTSKAILIYNEGAGASKVTVKGCTFTAAAGAKAGAIANQNCAAIEIDNFQSSGVGVAHELITEGNNYNEHFSGEWRIKNFVAGNAVTVNGTEYTQIAIDGKLMTIDADKNVTVLE